MIRIGRVGRPLARGASPLARASHSHTSPNSREPHLISRPGSDGLAGWLTQHVAAGASVAARQDRPAARTANFRWRTIATPHRLPHTIQLCIHCRQNPAGFWVSRSGSQTVRRP